MEARDAYLLQLCETPWPWRGPTCWTWPSWVSKAWSSQLWASDELWTRTTHPSSSSLSSWSTASNMASKVKWSSCWRCPVVILCFRNCFLLYQQHQSHTVQRRCVQFSFFCVLPVKKSFLGFNKSLWGPLELVEKLCPEAAEISASVRDLPGLKWVCVLSVENY